MAEVDTSIYRNQPDPLGSGQKVFNLLNTAAQNQLLQTATQQRALELQQSQANDLRATAGSLFNTPGLTPAQLKAAIADRARQLQLNPNSPVVGTMMKRYSGPDWKSNLGIDATSALGPDKLLQRETVTDEKGRTSSIPGTVVLGRPLATGIGPAATAAESAAGAGAGAVFADEATTQTRYRNQVNPLERAIPALERLGTTGTGPGKDEINQMKSVAVSFGFAPDHWTGSVKDFDEARKYLTDWVRQNGDVTTNDKLAASFSSSPSTKISNAAAVEVAKTALALRRMQYMQLQAFRATGKPAEDYPAFAATWNAQHDPRAFGFDHMTKEQRNKIINTLPQGKTVNGKYIPGKREQFIDDVKAADQAGVLSNQ